MKSPDSLLAKARSWNGHAGTPTPTNVAGWTRLFKDKRYADLLSAARAACESSGGDPAYASWIGVATINSGDPALGERWLELAIEADPRDARAHAALGFVGGLLGRGVARVAHYRRAVELSPKDLVLRANCAEAMINEGLPEEAETLSRQCLALEPGNVRCSITFARALLAQGRHVDGIESLESSLGSRDSRDLHWNLADAYLRTGRYREGFRKYEYRRNPSFFQPHVDLQGFSKPEWRGEPLAGRRLLVVHEQGIGDSLMALRYAAALSGQGESLSALVPSSLVRLLASQLWLQKVFDLDKGALPRESYDCWCPIMSLPALLGEDGNTPAMPKPYLRAAPEASMKLGAKNRSLRVGVCWGGSPMNPIDAFRSLPVSAFKPLADVPDVELVSCQHGFEVAAPPAFIRPPPRPIADLADTAALLDQVDLLISVDTAPAHLAGAMGRKVWLLARWFGDWRWGDTGETTWWYPAMRLFRQPRSRDWGAVIEEVQKALAAIRP